MRAIAVIFADAEEVACTVIRAGLQSRQGFEAVPVGTRVPNPRPDTFVRLLRTGGPQDTPVTDMAQLTIESWSNDQATASDVANLCRAFLQAAVGTVVNGTPVYGYQEFTGPQNLPDPTSAQPRYSFTVRLRLRGQALA